MRHDCSLLGAKLNSFPVWQKSMSPRILFSVFYLEQISFLYNIPEKYKNKQGPIHMEVENHRWGDTQKLSPAHNSH